MRSPLISAVVLLHLLFSAPSIMAQRQGETLDHTLLWRIQGKGLDRPCYLFGTMHIKNKSAFYFSDSLYAALEGVAGFAMEVDPDSLVGMVFRHALDQSKAKMLRDILDKEQLSKLDQRVKKEFGISADKLTEKDAYLLKEKLTLPDSKGEEMPTFMDAYLYSIARDRGERITGLERPEDQEVLLEDMETKFDPRSLVEDDANSRRFSDNLMKVYNDQNLPLVDSIISFGSDSVELVTMDKRNHVMVHSMDSLFHTGSYFVAVGAAHLPGSIGLISLLRNEGYTVQAVFSARKLAPGSYVFTREKEKEWVQVRAPEDGYEVYLPGPSQDYPIAAGVKLKIYVDLTNSTFFEAGSGPSLFKLTDATRDSLLGVVVDGMAKKINAHITKKTAVIQDSLKGLEVELLAPANNLTLKTRVFLSSQHVYILVLGSQTKGAVTPYMEARFFGSLSVFPPEVTAVRNLVLEPGYYCSFVVPGRDEASALPKQESSQSSFHQVSDPVSGNMFTATFTRALPGYRLSPDSESLHNSLNRMMAVWPNPSIVNRDTTYLGHTALSISGTVRGTQLRGILLKRGNYQYNLLAYGQEDSSLKPEADSFFASLTLLPLGEMPWSRKTGADSNFTIRAPDHRWETGNQWIDTVRMETYFMTTAVLSPYTFGTSDTAFLRKRFLRFHQADPNYQLGWSTRQGLREMTFLIHNKGYVERGAYFLDGNKVYSQGAFLNPGRENGADVAAFFDSLRFIKPVAFAGFPARGPAKLLDSLHSSDSLVRAIAFAFVDSADFEANDLPRMLHEMLYENVVDSLQDFTSWYVLEKACKKIFSDQSLPLLGSTYRSLTPELESRRYDVLGMVASIKTRAAFDSLLALLSYTLPTKGNAYEVFWKLGDTLALTKGIYPDLMRYQSDSLWGPALFPLYNKLVDSGFVDIGGFARGERDILQFAYDYSSRRGKDSNIDGRFDEMTDFLKRFRDTAARAFFTAGANLSNLSDEFSSTCALMFMGDAVSPKALQTLAKDDFYRQALYDSLVSHQKAALFPAAFLSRRALAVSNLVRSLDEDEDEDDDLPQARPEVRFIRDGAYTFKGKKAQFLLFDVRFRGADSSFLGVAGPYAPGNRKLRIDKDTDLSGCYLKYRLDRKRVDAQVREYLDSLSRVEGPDDDNP